METGVKILSAEMSFTRRPFLRPLRLSSGTITDITEARATVTVECGGQTATGHGAIYLSDLWAWPDPSLSSAERDAEMRAFAVQMAASLPAIAGADRPHPLEAGLRLHDAALQAAATLPPLARLVSASPLDAALHDATGRALGVSAFALYGEDVAIPSADARFSEGTATAVRRLLDHAPSETLDALLVVGKGDDLNELTPWITERGYRGFKLKVGGSDPEEDAARVSSVYAWARGLGVEKPRLTVDANCAAPDAATVAIFLDRLAIRDSAAYNALETIEQPTGRDIRTYAFDWHAVAAKKPLLVDEGLTDWDILTLAESQGWNGVAVKTCRGHSFALATAAWAHARGWTLNMMDLTNPGFAAIHSAFFGAHLPGVTAIELNATQYTPAANAEWLPRLASLLEPGDGTHRLPMPIPVGLGE